MTKVNESKSKVYWFTFSTIISSLRDDAVLIGQCNSNLMMSFKVDPTQSLKILNGFRQVPAITLVTFARTESRIDLRIRVIVISQVLRYYLTKPSWLKESISRIATEYFLLLLSLEGFASLGRSG